MSGLEWQAVLQELHNGTLVVCIQRGDDWENGRHFASFTELEQEEHPERIEELDGLGKTGSWATESEDERTEFDRLLRRP